MLQTKRRTHRLKASNERLRAINKDIDRIQEESLRAWAVAEINQERTQEIRVSLDELLSKQEGSLKRLMMLSERDENAERLVAVSRE